MKILNNDNINDLIDNPVTLRCPGCGVTSAMIPVSVPKYALVHRFKLSEVGLVFRCSSCNEPIFLQFKVINLADPIHLSEEFEQINTSLEPFETKYLTGTVLDDFNEALICYANSCWNAFAAMCRRCIQSVCAALGADGKSKVHAQLQDLKSMGVADDETFDQLHQIMLSGHDGAHPHLPPLSPAGVVSVCCCKKAGAKTQ